MIESWTAETYPQETKYVLLLSSCLFEVESYNHISVLQKWWRDVTLMQELGLHVFYTFLCSVQVGVWQ